MFCAKKVTKLPDLTVLIKIKTESASKSGSPLHATPLRIYDSHCTVGFLFLLQEDVLYVPVTRNKIPPSPTQLLSDSEC
jgi:hypothetical protein